MRINLHTLSNTLVSQDIYRHKIDVVRVQYLTGSVREATLGKKFRTLHKEKNGVGFDEVLDSFVDGVGGDVVIRIVIFGHHVYAGPQGAASGGRLLKPLNHG